MTPQEIKENNILLTEFLEIHYVVSTEIEAYYNDTSEEIFDGMGDRWEKAQEWSTEFYEAHKGEVWDGDWLDAVENFVSKKIKELQGGN